MAEDEYCVAKFSVDRRQNPSATFQLEDSPASNTRSANDDTVSVAASDYVGLTTYAMSKEHNTLIRYCRFYFAQLA